MGGCGGNGRELIIGEGKEEKEGREEERRDRGLGME